MWSHNMNTLTIGLLALVVLSGCVSTRHDLSTGEETALIESQDRFWSRCTIYGPFPIRPRTSTSNSHDSLLVDAGLVNIVTRCIQDDPFGDSVYYNAKFSFVAEAGHTYNFSGKGTDCYPLLDVTADGRVVACEPYYRGNYDNQSTGDDVATFITVGDPYSDDFCRVNKEDVWRSGGLLEVDAGPIRINAICEKNGWWSKTKRTSSFDFVAEAGHTYRFTASKKERMGLLDVTSGEKVIACNPYEEDK